MNFILHIKKYKDTNNIMRALKAYIFLYLVFVFFLSKTKNKYNTYCTITIPKSGTHLLTKCIRLIHGWPIKERSHNDNKEKIHKETKEYIQDDLISLMVERQLPKSLKNESAHLPYTQKTYSIIIKKCEKILFLIRDPRDQLISYIRFSSDKENFQNHELRNDLLSIMLQKRPKHAYSGCRQQVIADFIWNFGITNFYDLYIPWLQCKNTYTVKFENLVGSRGGGSDQDQMKELKNIAQHIGISLTHNRALEITEKLFGGTGTFREGQIGSWKKYFTKEHKALFKEHAGQLLIDLGYEKDLNW